MSGIVLSAAGGPDRRVSRRGPPAWPERLRGGRDAEQGTKLLRSPRPTRLITVFVPARGGVVRRPEQPAVTRRRHGLLGRAAGRLRPPDRAVRPGSTRPSTPCRRPVSRAAAPTHEWPGPARTLSNR